MNNLAKYNQAKTITFDLVAPDGVDLVTGATFAAGDVVIMSDEGVEANSTNLPTDEGTGYSLVLTAAEMSAARLRVYIIDQTVSKVWLDISIGLETYGNPSAEHAFDLDTASVPQTADNDTKLSNLQSRIPAALVGGLMSSDVTAISTDQAAADNLEAMYDGTGYTDDNAPSTQVQLGQLSVGTAAISKSASGAVITVGSEVNTWESTRTANGVYHEVASVGGAIDFYYEFDVGANAIGVDVSFVGHMFSSNDSVDLFAYNWIDLTWDQVGVFIGSNSSSDVSAVADIYLQHTGVGANEGLVRMRAYNPSGLTSATLFMGHIYISYTSTVDVATALSDIHLDHLFAVEYDPASKPGAATALLNELIESDGGVSRYTANALEQAPSGGGGSGKIGNSPQSFTLAKGATSQIVQFSAYDSSDADGGKLAGLLFNTASLTAYFNRSGETGAATQISLVTATKGTFTSSGFIAVDATNQPGEYELHIPNAVLATGADRATIVIEGAANLKPITINIDLVAEIDLGSDNRALVSADAHTSGETVADVAATVNGNIVEILGTPTPETSSGNLANNFSTFYDNSNSLTAKTVDDVGVAGSGLTQQNVADAMKLAPTAGAPAAGSVNAALDDIELDTDELQTNQGDWLTATGFNTIAPDNASIAAILIDTATTIPALIAALNDISAAQVNSEVDTAISDAALATAAALATVDTVADAIKVITDQFVFTVANQVDSNMQSVNNITITGDGGGTPFDV